MNRILQRARQAQQNVSRRAAREAGKREKNIEHDERQSRKVFNAQSTHYIKEERRRRRTDYETGTLAPRYDVGENAEKYGTLDAYVLQGPKRMWREYKHDVCPFADGDRVVIQAGKDKGRIGKVMHLSEANGTVTVDGLNQADWWVPEYHRREAGEEREIVAHSVPIPFKDVRLVHTLRDPETQTFKDVILDKIELRGAGFNQVTREYRRGRRYVPGLNQVIPWPEKADEPEGEPNDDDTFRIDVDAVTDRPYLLQAPMPPSVIDELRNKYGVHRVRHDPDYVARKQAEEAAVTRRANLAKLVSTPTMELREKVRQERLAKEAELSEAQLAKIGEIMAQESSNAARRVAMGQQ